MTNNQNTSESSVTYPRLTQNNIAILSQLTMEKQEMDKMKQYLLPENVLCFNENNKAICPQQIITLTNTIHDSNIQSNSSATRKRKSNVDKLCDPLDYAKLLSSFYDAPKPDTPPAKQIPFWLDPVWSFARPWSPKTSDVNVSKIFSFYFSKYLYYDWIQ